MSLFASIKKGFSFVMMSMGISTYADKSSLFSVRPAVRPSVEPASEPVPKPTAKLDQR